MSPRRKHSHTDGIWSKFCSFGRINLIAVEQSCNVALWSYLAKRAWLNVGHPCKRGLETLCVFEPHGRELKRFRYGTTVRLQRQGWSPLIKTVKWTICFRVPGLVKILNLHFRTFFMFISILRIVSGLDATWWSVQPKTTGQQLLCTQVVFFPNTCLKKKLCAFF